MIAVGGQSHGRFMCALKSTERQVIELQLPAIVEQETSSA